MVNYIVNPEKRRVVAILKNCQLDAINSVYRVCLRAGCEYVPDADLLMKDTYVGVAKCNPEDVWDEEVGKKLALERCLTKYNRDEKRIIEAQAIVFHDMMKACEAVVDEINKRKYK